MLYPIELIAQIESRLRSELVNLDTNDIIDQVCTALISRSNVILYGPPGHAKSNIVKIIREEMIKYHNDPDIFGLYQMNSETNTNAIFGDVNIKLFREESIVVNNIHDTLLMRCRAVLFEEMLDAPINVLCALKEPIMSGYASDNLTSHKMKAEVFYACTNIDPIDLLDMLDNVGMKNSVSALMDRFPMRIEIKWEKYDRLAYERLLNLHYKMNGYEYPFEEKINSHIAKILAFISEKLIECEVLPLNPRCASVALAAFNKVYCVVGDERFAMAVNALKYHLTSYYINEPLIDNGFIAKVNKEFDELVKIFGVMNGFDDSIIFKSFNAIKAKHPDYEEKIDSLISSLSDYERLPLISEDSTSITSILKELELTEFYESLIKLREETLTSTKVLQDEILKSIITQYDNEEDGERNITEMELIRYLREKKRGNKVSAKHQSLADTLDSRKILIERIKQLEVMMNISTIDSDEIPGILGITDEEFTNLQAYLTLDVTETYDDR